MKTEVDQAYDMGREVGYESGYSDGYLNAVQDAKKSIKDALFWFRLFYSKEAYSIPPIDTFISEINERLEILEPFSEIDLGEDDANN